MIHFWLVEDSENVPDDLKPFRANIPLMKRIAVALGIIASTTLLSAGSYQLPTVSLSVKKVPLPTVNATAVTVNVMNSGSKPGYPVLVWTDPHTSVEKAAFCGVHDLGILIGDIR